MMVLEKGGYIPTGWTVPYDYDINLSCLADLVNHLESNDFTLLSHNNVGIVIKKKPFVPPATVVDLHDVDIRLIDLTDKVNNMTLSNSISDPEAKEVTGEFFLLFDLLPEHIRKELKIYINKK